MLRKRVSQKAKPKALFGQERNQPKTSSQGCPSNKRKQILIQAERGLRPGLTSHSWYVNRAMLDSGERKHHASRGLRVLALSIFCISVAALPASPQRLKRACELLTKRDVESATGLVLDQQQER